ncbi:MAG: membrane integrity-associated transporter subunit PqiC [Chromatiales bacterium]|nr:membrane integrity-associated transporter subunit PqiC [Chromatiales bacterium]
MNRRRTARLTASVALALVIAACASSPAPRYFRLVALAEPVAAASPAGTAVIIGPFQLAEYLDRPQLVTRDGPNGVTVADYERWAEPLDANFQAAVAANVGRLLGSDQVLEFPAQTILKGGRRVTGRVLQFDVDAAGLAVLEVQWGVLDGASAVVRPGRVSRYEARASGPAAAARVAAMNATVTAFSADVAAAVN